MNKIKNTDLSQNVTSEEAGNVMGGYELKNVLVSSVQHAASGLPTGKRQHKPVSVTKPVDK